MKLCSDCGIVYNDETGCPLCREHNLRTLAEKRIDKLLEFRRETMEKTVLTIPDLAKILNKKVRTLYIWHSTKKPYPDFPFQNMCGKLVAQKQKVIDWSIQHNYPLELMGVSG